MLNVGEERDQREILRRLVELQYERNDFAFARNKFRVRGDTIEVLPRVRGAGRPHPALRRRGRAHLRGRPAHRRDRRGARLRSRCSRRRTTPPTRSACGRRSPASRPSWRSGSPSWRAQQQAARGAAPAHAHQLRPRDVARGRAAARASRTTRCTSTAGSRHQPPYTLLDYFPDDWLCVLDESHVAIPQLHGQFEGDRSRKETLVDARLPPAVGDGQPAAALRGVHRAGQPGRVHVGDAGRVRARDLDAGRRAGRAADRPHRSRSDREADEGPDRRPRRRDQRPRRDRSARARHDAHEEDVGGPHRLPPRARHPRALPALRDRHARAHRDPALAAARRVRRARRHQPAAGRARPARGVAGRDPRRRQGRASCARRRR